MLSSYIVVTLLFFAYELGRQLGEKNYSEAIGIVMMFPIFFRALGLI